jgi:hypothetical protein
MRIVLAGLLLCSACFSGAASAACEMPSLVGAIPDGGTATEQQLAAAQTEVRAYVEAMDRYIACENQELAARRESASPEFLYLMSTRIESARREVDAVATRFNDQVNAFRASRSGASLPPR